MTYSTERIKHLEFLQATIARQASHSFAVKGWSLTVAGLIYAYAASHLMWWLAVVALMSAIAFAWLDLFYLRQERLFRMLYQDVVSREVGYEPFTMDTSPHQSEVRCTYKDVSKSSTWWILHAMIIAVGLVLLLVALFQRLHSEETPECVASLIEDCIRSGHFGRPDVADGIIRPPRYEVNV